ncbi:hypothetical protein TELCIR_11394, partial [Teladorsagia circumcincta]
PRQTIREDIERALASYSVDQEPECLVQAYYQRMQTNPNLNAVIQELQRCANIVPINVTHRTVRDTSVGSVRIPEDTLIIGDIHYIMANSPVFEDAQKFRPERFLMEDGVTPNKIEPCKGRTIDLEPVFASVLFPKEQPLRLVPVPH